MFLRIFSFLIVLFFCISCNKLPFSKKNEIKELDTIIDFSSVDISPSFKICDSLFDKQEKYDCFTKIIHKKIRKQLLQHKLTIKHSIDEIVYVDLIINAKGIFLLDTIKSSQKIKNELPELHNLLKKSIQKISKIYPAIKRGIPVTTKYRLPIHIQLKE